MITGFDALGRTAEVNRLRDMLADIAATLGPEAIKEEMNTSEIVRRFGEGRNVEGLQDLLKTPEQKQADQQSAAMAAAGQAAAPAIAKAGMEAATAPPE